MQENHSQDLVIQGLLRRLSRMQQMLVVSRILNETLELDTLLRYIMETATTLTGTEAASILLVSEKTDQLRFAAATGIKRGDLPGLPVPRDKSIAGQILSSGKPLVINDARRSPYFYEGVDDRLNFRTRSLMGVPLEVKDRPIGVLEVVNKVDGQPFSEDDLEVLTILGAQAAVSIENARLFEQSDAISDVVHELRTPLTSIIGYSKMLLMADSLPAETLRQFASTIHREASRLGDMVNNFLELSRLESGRARLNREEMDLSALIQEVAGLLEPQAQEREITVCADLPPAQMILADPARMRQVFVNLIGNAIKYNRAGGQVRVALAASDDEVVVSVEDTGQGIEPENLALIFDKFYRGEEQEGQAKGTGLGLAIVKQIVDLHEGRIDVRSEPGVGSTFTVALPRQPAPASTE